MDPKEARVAAYLKWMFTFIHPRNICLLLTDQEEQDSSRQLSQLSSAQKCNSLTLQASKADTILLMALLNLKEDAQLVYHHLEDTQFKLQFNSQMRKSQLSPDKVI